MIEIDWAEHAGRLRSAAEGEGDWNAAVARSLVRDGDRVAVDVGCGGGGMARALAEALGADGSVVAIDADPDVLEQARAHTGGLVRCELVSMDGGAEPLRQAIGAPADLVWASASVHHAGDQQAAIDALASLLAPGGRLAVAEGGLPARYLPWDLGVGEPGLELRLDAAQDRWFKAMRDGLPGSVPMGYGWTEALTRAGLGDVRTRSVLTEVSAPLPADRQQAVVDHFRFRIEQLLGTGLGRDDAADGGHGHGAGHGHGHSVAEQEWLSAEDRAAWEELLDAGSPQYLGLRRDLTVLSVRSIHLGHAAR